MFRKIPPECSAGTEADCEVGVTPLNGRKSPASRLLQAGRLMTHFRLASAGPPCQVPARIRNESRHGPGFCQPGRERPRWLRAQNPDVRSARGFEQIAPEDDDRPDAQAGFLFFTPGAQTIQRRLRIMSATTALPSSGSASARKTRIIISGTTTARGSSTTPCTRRRSPRSGCAGRSARARSPWPGSAATRSSPTGRRSSAPVRRSAVAA